jgi:TRAP-type mannitol/chloroaromatic compound transport system permease small subunit
MSARSPEKEDFRDRRAREGTPPVRYGAFDRFIVGMNTLGSLWILFLVLLVTSDALGRTFLAYPIAGTHEMVQISVVGIVFLQLADTIRNGRLTRSDSFLALMHARWSRAGALFEGLFCLLGAAFMGIGLWGSIPLLKEAIERGSYLGNEGIFTAPVWPVKTIIVLGLGACLVQFLRLAAAAARRTFR